MQRLSHWTPQLEDLIHSEALAAGFHRAGVTSADPDTSPDSDRERFSAWIEDGRAGEMEYLKRRDPSGAFLRSHLQTAIPWAQSILVCALNYNAAAPRSIDPAPRTSGWIGRYAWSGRSGANANPPENAASGASPQTGASGKGIAPPDHSLIPTDYHNEMLARLRLLETRLHARADCETRCYVDTGPILERAFAARAGVGWIGKNTCVINQQLGSWLLLGVIVTSLPVTPAQAGPSLALAADRCGSCTRCIDACPTGALVAPRQMDASRCISYLTIEKKGSIAEELRASMGRQVFGCDICQDVCPWNRKAPIAVTPGMEPRTELVNPELEALAQLDSAGFKRRFKGSPLERTGRKRLQRNVAIAMGNSGGAQFLSQLEAWAGSEDVVLADAAQWAIDRIGTLQAAP
ncbi:MAG TPA: tRNA epoxyqueuosine(34) reductase QueG [Granulicella sp.]|jgi:epoxyqueuosine reductase|nr:tRNA epoxyqueuosine(34) reductase QueG [Granulicella sp.]